VWVSKTLNRRMYVWVEFNPRTLRGLIANGVLSKCRYVVYFINLTKYFNVLGLEFGEEASYQWYCLGRKWNPDLSIMDSFAEVVDASGELDGSF